jgi:hypothetical protein
MKKRLFFLCLAFIVLPAAGFCESIFKVNGQKLEEGGSATLFKSDLEASKIEFEFHGDNLSAVEISLDGGRSWETAKKEDDAFILRYRPLRDDKFNPVLLLTTTDNVKKIYKTNAEIVYCVNKPDEAIALCLEKLETYYENQKIDNFINLFSSQFPDRVKFKESIQNDFYNYRNIRFSYRVDRKVFDNDYGGAVCDVYFERKYENRDGASGSDNATINIRFDKEDSGWLITGFRNNTIFGSSLLTANSTSAGDASASNPDLKISSSDISVTNTGTGILTASISVNVHNDGNSVANSVKLKYYKKVTSASGIATDSDFVEIATKTISSILPGSQESAQTVTYNFSGATSVTADYKVVVDYDNLIAESDETNNSAVKTVSLTATVDLSVSASDIIITSPYGTHTVKVTVHNPGTLNLTNVSVKILFKYGSAPADSDVLTTTTVSSISAGSTADTGEFSYTNSGPGTYYFKAIIDPSNTITESDETNNQASNTYSI